MYDFRSFCQIQKVEYVPVIHHSLKKALGCPLCNKIEFQPLKLMRVDGKLYFLECNGCQLFKWMSGRFSKKHSSHNCQWFLDGTVFSDEEFQRVVKMKAFQ